MVGINALDYQRLSKHAMKPIALASLNDHTEIEVFTRLSTGGDQAKK